MAQTNSTPEWFNPTGVSKTKPPPTTTVEEEEEVEETSDTPAWFKPTDEETDDSVEETTTEVEEKIPPKGGGVASLPKPKSKKEELQKRRDMVWSGFGMGIPGLLPSDPLSRIAPTAIGKVAGSPFTSSQFVGELVAPETTKKVTDWVGNIDKELQKNQFYKYIRDSLVGEGLTETEEILSRIPSYLILSKAAQAGLKQLTKKITKDEKKLQKTSAVLGAGAGFVSADVITRKENEQMAPDLAEAINLISGEPEILEEVIDIANQLKINPEDTTQQARAKQLTDSVATTALFAPVAIILAAPFKLGKVTAKGIRTLRNKNKAIDDGLTTVPENTPTARVNSSEVVEEVVEEGAEPVLKQKNKITQVLAEINTKAGRMLASNASLPAKVFNAALQRSRADKASDLEVKVVLEDLVKIQKQTGDSDQLLAKFINEGIDAGLDPRLREQANLVKRMIVNKEAEINKLLGLTGKDKIGLGFNNGDVYFTRMFEANNNPTYLKQIQKALKGKKVDSSFISKVEGARNYLRGKKVPEAEIDGTIAAMVRRLSGTKEEGLLSNMFEGMSKEIEGVSSRAAQVLRKRENIKDPILDLLGQQKDPMAKISSTLSNQNKVISELQYLSEVDKFFRRNIGKEIELGGLIPRLGGARKKVGGKAHGVDELENLQKLSEEAIGRLGGSTKLLQDIYVDPQTYRYISRGLDLFNPKGGGWFSNTFSQIAAYGQATQTILDLPAYLINTYGATQALISNGVLFNTAIAKQAAMSAKTFGQSLTPVRKGLGPNRKALEKLDKLKRAGVIDTDLTSEMISQNINVYGKRITSKAGKAGELYSKGMQKASTAYGSPDTYSKLLAFEAENAALKKIFPRVGKESIKEYDDRIFNMAAERVRDTMPSYSVAAPAARSLSRLPFGTYALFPSEMVRTTKNQLKYAFRDLREGTKNKNMAQAAHGLKRLTGLGITGVGTDYVVNDNNEQLGVTDINSRAIDMLSPDWGKSGKRFHNTNFMENEDGTITANWVNSYSFDAQDYLKVPIRAMTGKILAGKEVSDVEIEDTVAGMAKSIIGPYTNPKFITEALINLAQKELYSDVPGETGISKENLKRIWGEIAPAVQPGTLQIINKYLDSLTSEEIEERRIGQNRYGFPQSSEDILTWMSTGLRPITINLEKSIGFNMSQDIKGVKSTKDAFMRTLKELKDQPYTPEIREDLMNRYKELQDAKFKAMQDISDKVQIFSQISYEDKNNKSQPFGFEKVLKSATDGFYYDIPDELIYAKRIGEGLEAGGGVFMPDLLHTDDRLIRELRKKSFGNTLLEELAGASAEYVGRTLRESKSKIPEGFTLVE